MSNENSRFLTNEKPLLVLPSLIAAVGFGKALILQQIHSRARQKQKALLHDGRVFAFASAEYLCKHVFTFWLPEQLITLREQLIESDLLISGYVIPYGVYAYRVNYEKIPLEFFINEEDFDNE